MNLEVEEVVEPENRMAALEGWIYTYPVMACEEEEQQLRWWWADDPQV
jgi:hypothetical protein